MLEEQEAASVRAQAESYAADGRWLECESADDLAQASAHRRALEARAVRAKAAASLAAALVSSKQVAAVEARIAERRFEILIEGFLRADAACEQKVERRSSDEHAARRRQAT